MMFGPIPPMGRVLKSVQRAQHLRRYLIKPDALHSLLIKPAKWEVVNGPPPDATITNAEHVRGMVAITVEHISFDQVPAGHAIPEVLMGLRPAPPPEPRSYRGYELI